MAPKPTRRTVRSAHHPRRADREGHRPDRHPRRERRDELRVVRGDDDGRVPEREGADPVHRGDRAHVVLRRDVLAHLAQPLQRARVRGVLQPVDLLAAVVVAHRADEQRQPASGLVGERGEHLGDVERRLADVDEPDDGCVVGGGVVGHVGEPTARRASATTRTASTRCGPRVGWGHDERPWRPPRRRRAGRQQLQATDGRPAPRRSLVPKGPAAGRCGRARDRATGHSAPRRRHGRAAHHAARHGDRDVHQERAGSARGIEHGEILQTTAQRLDVAR